MFNFRRPYKKSATDKVLDGTVTESHESFGLVTISRIQGGAHLFGSAIERHGSFIALTISEAEVNHNISRDWYYGRRELITVYLSAAQFAEAITSFNLGSGVPCTINRVLGEQMEPVPQETKIEGEKIREGFEEKLQGLVGFLRGKVAQTKTLLEKKSLSKTDKEEILWALEKTLQEIHANAPYVLQSFQESAEKVATATKAEIEAFTTLAVSRMGLESLRQRLQEGEAPPVLSLPPSDKEGDRS